MDFVLITGLVCNLIGIVIIALAFKFGFSTDKENDDFWINDKRPVVWKYKNDKLLYLGWTFIIIGFTFQIFSAITTQIN